MCIKQYLVEFVLNDDDFSTIRCCRNRVSANNISSRYVFV